MRLGLFLLPVLYLLVVLWLQPPDRLGDSDRIPWLGRLMYEALYGRDYPVLMGLFVCVSAAVVLANLVTDLAYARLDPRIRLA